MQVGAIFHFVGEVPLMQPTAEEFKRRCSRIRNAAERGDMRQVRWERRQMDLLLDAKLDTLLTGSK
jgi:hypothetical protein